MGSECGIRYDRPRDRQRRRPWQEEIAVWRQSPTPLENGL